MYIGKSLHSEFLQLFTQILREVISPMMTVISVKVAFTIVLDS